MKIPPVRISLAMISLGRSLYKFDRRSSGMITKRGERYVGWLHTKKICCSFEGTKNDYWLASHVQREDRAWIFEYWLQTYHRTQQQYISPYSFPHSANLNQGIFDGTCRTFPRMGIPLGPGGIAFARRYELHILGIRKTARSPGTHFNKVEASSPDGIDSEEGILGRKQWVEHCPFPPACFYWIQPTSTATVHSLMGGFTQSSQSGLREHSHLYGLVRLLTWL